MRTHRSVFFSAPFGPMAAALGMALLLAAGTAAGQGSWERAPNMPTCRSELAAASLDGWIYVAGGLALRGTLAAFEAFHPETGSWKKLPPLPTALHHPAMAAAAGRVVLTGGYASLTFGTPEQSTWAFDVARGAWERKSDMPGPRAAHAMVNLGGTFYVVGGVGSEGVWAYHPARDLWSQNLPALPTPREHLAAVALAGRLYVVAGRWRSQGNLTALEAFDPEAKAWRALPSLPTARGGLTAAAVAGRIHVTGGEAFSPRRTFAEHEVYDPASQAWSMAPPMPTARHGLASTEMGGRWYVIGGGTKAGMKTLFTTSCTVEVYTP